jgi:hypothetical protein
VIWVWVRPDLIDAARVALRPSQVENYLERRLPNYAMMRYINGYLRAGDKVFSVSEQGLYHVRKPYLTGVPHLQIFVDYRTMPDFANFLARMKELQVTHLLLRPLQQPPVDHLVGAPVAAASILFKRIDFSCLREEYSHQGLVLYRILYPPNLEPYNRELRISPIDLGNVLLEYGMLERAMHQFAAAGPAGARQLAQLDRLTPMQIGDFYRDKAEQFRSTIFLKPALNAYALGVAGAVSADERAEVERRRLKVRDLGRRMAPHIWWRLPDASWWIPGHGLP